MATIAHKLPVSY